MNRIPETIGPYGIVRVLGQGGMGIVYQGEHLQTGQAAAIKTVRFFRAELMRSLRREIHALARIRHPGVVQILDHGVDNGMPWYAMELLAGSSLRQLLSQWEASGRPKTSTPVTGAEEASGTWWTDAIGAETLAGESSLGATLARNGQPDRPIGQDGPDRTGAWVGAASLPLSGRLTLVRRLCSALAFLHGEGIVHRDLKPGNILVQADGWPILVDFGLAGEFGNPVGRDFLEAEQAGTGTYAFMAPEQIRGEPLDARADLYALGCVLYQLITGHQVFQGTGPELRRAHLHVQPVPPSSFVPRLPQALDELVLGLLAKRREARIGHAGAVAAVLADLGATEGRGDLPEARSYLYRSRFVGQTRELQTLVNRLSELEAGVGGVGFIGGESGSGKTRLARELAQLASSRGIRVLMGECSSDGTGKIPGDQPPLAAWQRPLEEIADLCRSGGPAAAQSLLGPRAAILQDYQPALAEMPGLEDVASPPALPRVEALTRLYAALTRTLTALAESGPLLVLLDDLQWMDELSLGYLERLRAMEPPGTFLVVGLVRTEELSRPLQGLVAANEGGFVRLGRFEEAQVGAIVSEMLALSPPQPAFVKFLTTHSEGNPFFVTEYLRTAIAEGMLGRDERGVWRLHPSPGGAEPEVTYPELPLPGSVRALVHRRLDHLQSEVLHLVRSMAVLGREVDSELLALVSGLDDQKLLSAMEELKVREVVENGLNDRVRFVHDKIREATYERVPPEMRAELHRQAARGIETRWQARKDEHLAELGLHWERGNERGRARESYLAGAGRARKQVAYSEAERLYQAYLALVEEESPESVAARLSLGMGALHHQGRLAEAEACCQEGLSIARQLGDRNGEGHALGALGSVFLHLGDADAARLASEQALVILREVGDRPTEARTLHALGTYYREVGQIEEARQCHEQSIRICHELDLRFDEGLALNHLGLLQMDRGHLDRASEHFLESLSIFHGLGARRGEANVLGNLGLIDTQAGRLEEALTRYSEAMVISGEIHDRSGEAIWKAYLASLLRLLGRCPEAKELLESAEATLGKHKLYLYLACVWCERGHHQLLAGQSAAGELERARELFGQRGVEETEEGRRLFCLERAQAAFEEGQLHRLYQGQLVDDLTEGQRQWLVDRARLEPRGQRSGGIANGSFMT